MWRFALLGPLLVAGSDAHAQERRVNSSSTTFSSRTIQQTASQISSSSNRPSISLPVIVTSSSYQAGSSSTRSLSSHSASRSSSKYSLSITLEQPPPPLEPPPLDTYLDPFDRDDTPSTTSSRVPSATSIASSRISSHLNSTYVVSRSSKSTNSSAIPTGPCTGCVIQAYNPVTTFFDDDDKYNPWTSVVVTETIVTQFITYFDGSTIDTVVTEEKTVNQTKIVVGTMNETITATTPNFVIEATPGLYLTLLAGPTYVVYDNLIGGLDGYIGSKTTGACAPVPTQLKNWEPQRTEDWSYFIQTYTGEPPKETRNWPVPLPSKLIDFLKQDPDIRSQYRGSDIATCTTRPSQGPNATPGPDAPNMTIIFPKPTRVSQTPGLSGVPPTPPDDPKKTTDIEETVPATAPFESVTTGTFLSTTYESTSTHVTRQGCLRCENTKPNNVPVPTPEGPLSNKINDDPEPTYRPDEPSKPDDPNRLADTPKAPGLPDIIASIINNNPSIWPRPTAAPTADKSVTIGNTVLPINTAQPQTDPNRPSEQNQLPPFIVVGSETLTPGQTKTINGVPVVVPTGGGGTKLVVDGSTIVINTAPTGPPVLTVGSNTITADSQGQFVLGKETLKPGGPPITVDGTTLSLGPSGTIAVVNGVTQTLVNAAPTAAPVLTLNNGIVSGTVISGSTLFVFGPGQTLTPGGVLTISGTTFSLPASASGSVVIINGVTSTIANPTITKAAVLTINGNTYTATVRAGTTEYVLGPGTTLRPGEAVTISGTTYSLDPKGTALVINGRTSSIPTGPASNSASTTSSSLGVMSSSSARRSTTTSSRDAGDLIASGIGESSRGAGATTHGVGFDKWIEGLVIGAAGWVVMLL